MADMASALMALDDDEKSAASSSCSAPSQEPSASLLLAATSSSTMMPAAVSAPTSAAVKSAKATLLKHGLMPDYRHIQQSEEQLSNLLERRQNNENLQHQQQQQQQKKTKDGNINNVNNVPPQSPALSHHQPQTQIEEQTSQQVVILHSFFRHFCHPPPSMESVLNVLLLEKERVSSLQPRGKGRGGKKKDPNNNTTAKDKHENNGNVQQQQQPQQQEVSTSQLHQLSSSLPKETVIRTSSTSAQFVIKLLRASSSNNPKSCLLLRLPLEFQLSFFRLLTRLLTTEGDDEYDEECLFDWSFLEDGNDDDDLMEEEKGDEDDIGILDEWMNDPKLMGGNSSDADEDDDLSYDVVRKASIGGEIRERTTSHDRKMSSSNKNNRDRTMSSSSHTSFHRANSNDNNTGRAFETWSFGRWQKKKSSSLYSVIRFCTNPRWKEEEDASALERKGGSMRRSLGSRRRSLRWTFVADNVKLGKEEEEALSRESFHNDGNDSDDDDSDDGDDDGVRTAACGAEREVDVIGILIRIYQSILDKCLKSTAGNKSNKNSSSLEGVVGQYLLLGPVAHLIGLLCATKVSVKNLRLLLVLVEDTSYQKKNPSSGAVVVLNLARLHVVRALRYAAEYSIQFNGILDKPGPQTFFSFGDDNTNKKKEGGVERGLSASFDEMAWPFKYDFGMACWFRAESFLASQSGSDNDNDGEMIGRHVVLFSTRTKNGAQIEVSFESHSIEGPSSNTSAATLIVTVIDATANGSDDLNASKTLRKVRLVGCVLSPLVWYHVAVRLSRPRLSRFSLAPFSSKDEVSILLNGKLMLREHLKMPQFPDGKGSGSRGGLASSIGGALTGSAFGGSSSEPKKMPLEISFSPNFDGQAGSLYVFKDHVSEESIGALYRETIAPPSEHLSHFGSFVDHWDSNHGKLYHLTKAVSSASMHSELGDVVLPNYSVFTGEREYSQNQQRRILFDLAEEDDVDSDVIPVGLSREKFGSKLLLVWDPCRISNGVLIDPHLGAQVKLEDRASTWSFESVRDTIESLGGMPRLLPALGMLQHLIPGNKSSSSASSASSATKGIIDDYPNMLLPSLMFLFASFIREHEVNACEMYRCGGINVMEKLLHDSKKKDIDQGAFYRLGVSPLIAQYNASALLDLWQASRLNFALETCVFSRLIFNIPLLLGGVARSRGVSFHAVILPVLSEIAMMNPDKVRDCIETGEVFDVVNEYSRGESEESVHDTAADDLFYESTSSLSTFTIAEQCFVVDTLLGIITIMLAVRCPTHDLSPLLTFITYNLDLEWEANDTESNGDRSAKRSNRYLSTVKAVSILFFLLQKSNVPNLIDSLADIYENGNCVASWMLCCLVNSFDDTIRGLGIKCLAAYLRTTTSTTTINDVSNGALTGPSGQKLSKTMKRGLEVISHSANNMLSSVLSGRVNIKIIYKLLWHLLKCHRERLGDASNAALMYLITDAVSSSVPLSDIIVPNSELLGGFRLSLEELESKVDSRQSICNVWGISTVLRLLRFLSSEQKERWLFDILAFLLASPNSVNIILSCDDWQPVLFQLVAEVLEEIYGDDSDGTMDEAGNGSGNERSHSHAGPTTVNTETLSKPSVRTRYDLSLKLYSTLLGHCVRQGDEKAFDAVEMAASLQRVDANGSEIFSILLSHLFADLIEKGTIASIERTYSNTESSTAGRNRALKQSARLVTQSILSNGADGLDMASAVKQWRCLRHLTALTVAIVTESGFGIVQLFDYRNQDASAIDGITGGMYGIRLDNLVSGVNAFEALAGAKLHASSSGRHQRDRYRYVCVVLASQVLTLIDAFIFPDNLDTAKAASQLHGLALVRSTEPRLGQSQGTLLASLVRLSLILLAYLEPSSVKFLQACSRLRCFLHWVLEILRESVALGGYNAAFHELTAPLDRIVLAIVLQCHRALSRCSVVLLEMESSPWQKYYSDIESRQKCQRRLFRAILELREIVLAAYRGRNEVLRAALSPQAYEALARGLEEVTSTTPKASDFSSKEASLRSFLESDWVAGFHDVEGDGSLVIPEQIANGELYEGAASTRGKQAIEELAKESAAITKEYNGLLNAPFSVYCENQRKWAETDAVRDREYEGDVSVKRLSSKYRTDMVDLNKSMVTRFVLALQRWNRIVQLANDPWNRWRHWMFTSYTDLLYRRIVFHPNYSFSNHANASYELTLGKERDSIQRAEEARIERKMAEAVLRSAIVPYTESTDEDVDDEVEDLEKSDKEGFLGWDVEGRNELLDQQKQNGDEDGSMNRSDGEDDTSTDSKVNQKDNADETEWDQIESTDFDESNELDPFAWARKFMWAEGEHFVHNFESVVIVSIQCTRDGTLLLTSHSLYFHQTEDTIDVMTKEKMEDDGKNGPSRQDKKWKLNRLTDVHGRRYMLKAQALELFFANMEGVFLTFNGTKERDLFHAKLRGNCKAPLLRSFKSLNPRVVFKKSKLTELWRKRKISNFQYIMALNLMAGRTFNDITQYPVFPWILADYTSETLDLSDQSVYRDLTKPVGALNPDRLAQLINRYHDLDGFPEEEKFLYGSHYSSPGVVLHYLIRQEPYTSMHIALQSGRFDCADRQFFDMGGCWRSCNTSTSDVKELLPEFFSCPEMFTNTNDFPLGETQTKMAIDSVKLPPWANGSPHEFIRLHRLALESEYVSKNLHHWIDLIFGYKQRGPAALSANNLFHYLSYEGSVDIDKVTDDLERKAIEGHIQNFGQTPSQLIAKEPHPSRSFREEELIPLFQDLCPNNMRCDTPRKQFGGPNKSVIGAIISIHALGDSVFTIHSDFSICSYKVYHARGSAPFHFKMLESKNASLSHISHPGTSEINESEMIDNGRNLSFAIALGVNSRTTGNGNGSSDPSHLLMSCGYFDNCVKIHSLDSLQLQCSLNGGHRGQINCLEVGGEGEMMVTGGDDATCRIWIVDHNALAAAITDGFVKSSLVKEPKETKFYHVHTLLGHVTTISCVAISTKLDVVVSGSLGGSICLHNIRSGKFIRSLHVDTLSKEVQESCAGNGIPVRKLAIHVDGTFVAHLSDGSLRVFSINGQQLSSKHIGENLNAMIICQKSETLVTGGDMGCARIWKLHDLSLQCTVDVKKHGPITSLAFTPGESRFLCIGCSNGLLSIVSRIP